MYITDRKKLLEEYTKKIQFVYMPIVKLGAYNRLDLKNGEIDSIKKWSQFYSFLIILIVDVFGYLLLHETVVKNNFLTFPEYISVIEFTIFNNLSLININIANRHTGAELLNEILEIDVFMGVERTKFMRNIADKHTLILCMLFASFQLFFGIVLLLTFQLPIYIYIVGGTFFFLLMCNCYDNIFLVALFKFLCLRLHYLNLSLVKMAHLDTEYLMQHLLSYPFLWKKKYNDNVYLQMNSDPKFYIQAFKMILNQLQRISSCYRFLLFGCTASLVFGTFLAVQSIIIFLKDPELPVIRTFALCGWGVVSWMLLLGITGQADTVSVQIKRTKLICTYIQLNPNHPDELFDLTQSILEILGVNDCRMSIYGLYYFDGSLLRSIAISVFVYITMQLQIAFPNTPNTEVTVD